MTITIYFDQKGTSRQVIRPQGEANGRSRIPFQGSINELVDTITRSQPFRGIKNYHHWEVN